uniref:Response regulatory domain-containing protein n=1 Tax=Guillardia theta TaxID=55529 RepID=A0A7S4KXC6_GUITH
MFQRRPDERPAYCITSGHVMNALLIAKNETLRNSVLRLLEALGVNVSAVESTAKLPNNLQQFQVVIICPAASNDEGLSLATSPDIVKNGDDLNSSRNFLNRVAQDYSSVRTILLCPLTQLSQASDCRKIANCSVVSRPVRLSTLCEVLSQEGSQEEFGMSSKSLSQREMDTIPEEPSELKLLIAISNDSQRMVAKAILTREMYKCTVVTKAEEFSGSIKQTKEGWNHDVVFLELSKGNDKLQPVLETLRRIREIENNCSISKKLFVVGVLSGKESNTNEEVPDGVDVCLNMPLERSSITEAMQGIMRQRRSASIDAAMCGKSSENGLHRQVRVLVVDDDYGQRAVLKAMLQKEGFDVEVAEDGDQAVKAVLRVPYDVVLMDGFMPNKTGWEATVDIRKEESKFPDKRRVVIIGVTGATSKDDETKCFESGMTDVISKPVKREALTAKIRQWTKDIGGGAPEVLNPSKPFSSPCPCNDPKVLILSKDRANRIVLKKILSNVQFKSECVESAENYMKLLDIGGIDCIFMESNADYEIFGLLQETRQLLDSGRKSKFPIFAITSESDESTFVSRGFTNIIRKPFDKASIVSLMEEYVTSPEQKENENLELAQVNQVANGKAKGANILIVEDHWANRRLLEAMLIKQGHTMEAVENGLEAVNITGSRKYDVILMDCNMPIMDGWQVRVDLW